MGGDCEGVEGDICFIQIKTEIISDKIKGFIKRNDITPCRELSI